MPRSENLSHSSSENNLLLDNVTLTLGESNVSENLCNSLKENDTSAGAFRRAFAMKSERQVAFPEERIGFMLSEGKVTRVAPREGKWSRAQSSE